MQILWTIVLAVFGIILAGYLIGRLRLLGADSSQALNGFAYWVALPALLLVSMTRVPVTPVLGGFRRAAVRAADGRAGLHPGAAIRDLCRPCLERHSRHDAAFRADGAADPSHPWHVAGTCRGGMWLGHAARARPVTPVTPRDHLVSAVTARSRSLVSCSVTRRFRDKSDERLSEFSPAAIRK